MEKILIINLLGKRFHIPYRIVANYPQTLLGNDLLLSKYYRHDIKDYYFERNPLLFSYILTYYTLEKKIFCPHSIPLELIENECQFFKLNNSNIYHEINKNLTYQYFQRKKTFKNKNKNNFIFIIPFIISILFMITISMEISNNYFLNLSWSLTYFIELFNIILLTIIIFYQIIYKKDSFQNKCFLLDLFSTILSIFIIISQNLMIITNNYFINSLIMLLKTFRLCIIIAHLRILRLIIQTFIQRLKIIFILVFINIIIIGSFSEIAFAFERRQQEDQNNKLTMKTHFDAFWWATSLSFTIGFGHTDPHFTLTIIGRFCSYMLTFFGLLFNGLILQELIKGFLKIYREERRE
ncbi:unnamed protein product [Rotaria sordida]|uniref:Potassium channel domain-containing protein n=1 Tax=Rotaria sordida TaxID=392033 RepID=A0A814K706_9BILA|nr:unnamed protein product [Rotaria sordida]CAF1008171.1 unnamed protein product [Rotaria sordida]CAF1045370.1 unnamed protein product [Rotaria sordida]CAF1102311.1 unnamed protein product [Rotaria sordida]CAF1173807.1 unnamed protein product [Rotaria sordida]